jgi:hypothetical protein
MINAIGAEKSYIFCEHQDATIAEYAKTLARFLAFLEEVEKFAFFTSMMPSITDFVFSFKKS